jgi:hypothetical protein
MQPIEEIVAQHTKDISSIASTVERLGETQLKHGKVSLAHENEMAVFRAVLAALVATHPNKPFLHLAIQKAWDEARGTLGVPGMPDETTENARELLKAIGDILGKPIL